MRKGLRIGCMMLVCALGVAGAMGTAVLADTPENSSAALQAEAAKLQREIKSLQVANARLRAELARLESEKHADGAAAAAGSGKGEELRVVQLTDVFATMPAELFVHSGNMTERYARRAAFGTWLKSVTPPDQIFKVQLRISKLEHSLGGANGGNPAIADAAAPVSGVAGTASVTLEGKPTTIMVNAQFSKLLVSPKIAEGVPLEVYGIFYSTSLQGTGVTPGEAFQVELRGGTLEPPVADKKTGGNAGVEPSAGETASASEAKHGPAGAPGTLEALLNGIPREMMLTTQNIKAEKDYAKIMQWTKEHVTGKTVICVMTETNIHRTLHQKDLPNRVITDVHGRVEAIVNGQKCDVEVEAFGSGDSSVTEKDDGDPIKVTGKIVIVHRGVETPYTVQLSDCTFSPAAR